MLIKNGMHLESPCNAAAQYSLYMLRFWPRDSGKSSGMKFVVCLSVHISVVMHLIGWQPHGNQLNDRQTGLERSCTVQSKPIVRQSEAAILGFPLPTENRFQWIGWPSGIVIMQKAQQTKVVCCTFVLDFLLKRKVVVVKGKKRASVEY